MGLTQTHLLLQILVSSEARALLELRYQQMLASCAYVFVLTAPSLSVTTTPLFFSHPSVIDNTGCKRRLQLSSSHRNLSVTQLLIKTVLQGLPQDQWCNYCLDLGQLVPVFFSGHHFQSLEAIAIRGSCRLRRICTLRDLPLSTGDLPQFCQQLPSVPALPLVVREAHCEEMPGFFYC